MKLKKLLNGLKVIALISIAVFIVGLILLNLKKPTYYITANTEKITFTPLDNISSRIVLRGAQIANDDSILFKNFNGSFKINTNVKVEVERISNGPLDIFIEGKPSEKIGQLYKEYDNEKVLEASDFIEIRISNIDSLSNLGKNTIIPINGAANVGRSVGIETSGKSTALLKGGEVILTSSSICSNKQFISNRYDLLLGDRIELKDNRSFGFALVDDEPGMKVSIRTQAKEAIIMKPGPTDTDAGIKLTANWLDLLTKDELYRTFSFILGGILILTTFITFFFDFRNFKK